MSGPILRRCVSCRQLLDREQLWRVIRQATGGLVLDRGMGRSAYVCRCRACLEDARRRKRLQRALRIQVPDTVYASLEQRLNDLRVADVEAR